MTWFLVLDKSQEVIDWTRNTIPSGIRKRAAGTHTAHSCLYFILVLLAVCIETLSSSMNPLLDSLDDFLGNVMPNYFYNKYEKLPILPSPTLPFHFKQT